MTIGDLIAEGLPGKADWRSRMAEEWGESSPAFQSRTLARYGSDAEGALNPSSWVERAMDAAFDVGLPSVAGLDVAGSVTGNETALALVAEPEGKGSYRVRDVHAWQVRDTQEIKGSALRLVRGAGATLLRVDGVGLGRGVIDSVRQDFAAVEESRASDRRPDDPTRFANRKAEVAWTLRNLLEAGCVRLQGNSDLRAQLAAMRYEVTPRGTVRVVDPSDSPDHVDAVLHRPCWHSPAIWQG